MQRWHSNGPGYTDMMVYNGDNSEPSGSTAHRKFLQQVSNYELIKDYTAWHHLINMTKLYIILGPKFFQCLHSNMLLCRWAQICHSNNAPRGS